jgi:hypothetical protein
MLKQQDQQTKKWWGRKQKQKGRAVIFGIFSACRSTSASAGVFDRARFSARPLMVSAAYGPAEAQLHREIMTQLQLVRVNKLHRRSGREQSTWNSEHLDSLFARNIAAAALPDGMF